MDQQKKERLYIVTDCPSVPVFIGRGKRRRRDKLFGYHKFRKVKPTLLDTILKRSYYMDLDDGMVYDLSGYVENHLLFHIN